MNRSAGRGARVDVTTDSWRDAGGTLWTPNTLVPVDVPGLVLANKELLLAEVTYRYGDDGGTLADLVLMPAEAFLLEPIQLQPTLADIPAQAGAQ
jgi:prophage tail gpP-like protein